MTIRSLGVGSGLALDDLVQQLINAERKPKEDRLNAREEAVEAEISALGSIKSKLSHPRSTKHALSKAVKNMFLSSRLHLNTEHGKSSIIPNEVSPSDPV